MILLDTHVLLWAAARPRRLSPAALAALERGAREGLAVASVSLMELSQLLARGQVSFGGTPVAFLREILEGAGASVRDITVEIAAAAARLPSTFPGDPFDRLIAATALVGRMSLVTADDRIRRSSVVKTIW